MKPRHQTLAHDATTNTRRQLQLIRARSPRRRAQRQKVACFRQRPVAHSPQGGYRRINGQGCNDRPVTVHKGQGVQFGAAVEVADGHLNIRRHLVVAVIPLLPREAVGLVRGTVSQNPCSSNIALVLFPLVPAIELYRRVTPAHEDGPNCLPGRAMTARDRLVPEGVQIGSTPLQLQDSCEAVTYFLVCQPRPWHDSPLAGHGWWFGAALGLGLRLLGRLLEPFRVAPGVVFLALLDCLGQYRPALGLRTPVPLQVPLQLERFQLLGRHDLLQFVLLTWTKNAPLAGHVHKHARFDHPIVLVLGHLTLPRYAPRTSAHPAAGSHSPALRSAAPGRCWPRRNRRSRRGHRSPAARWPARHTPWPASPGQRRCGQPSYRPGSPPPAAPARPWCACRSNRHHRTHRPSFR